MKRLFVIFVLVSALAVPAAAVALDVDGERASPAKSTAKKSLKVGFIVQLVGGEPVNVQDFSFKRLKMDCDQGKVLLRATNLPDMGVVDRKFGDIFHSKKPEHDISVDGKFNKRTTKAKGSVSANGDFANSGGGGNFTNCSGSKDYEVKVG